MTTWFVILLLIPTLAQADYKCAYSRVMNVIRPDAYKIPVGNGEQNDGFMLHFKNAIETDSCLRSKALSFWEEIEALDLEVRQNKSKTNYMEERPGLTETVGKGRYEKLKPGWLWEKALKSADGNPNTAMALISLCMHDDRYHSFLYQVSPEEAQADAKKEKIKILVKIEEAREKLAMANSGTQEFLLLNDQIKQLTMFLSFYEQDAKDPSKISRNRYLKCPPPDNIVHAPQSLDASVDIPKSLKDEIQRLQKPDGGKIAAKSYHFVAGAYIGCQLASCGVVGEQVGTIASTLAGMYRAKRMCKKVKELLDLKTKISDEVDVDANAPNFHSKVQNKYRSLDPLINKKLVEFDAATLYERWYFGGKILPCAPLGPAAKPRDLNQEDWHKDLPALSPQKLGTVCNITGWSIERCEKARLKLSTWDIDYEWTLAQHAIGAKFGAAKCKSEDVDRSKSARDCSNNRILKEDKPTAVR